MRSQSRACLRSIALIISAKIWKRTQKIASVQGSFASKCMLYRLLLHKLVAQVINRLQNLWLQLLLKFAIFIGCTSSLFEYRQTDFVQRWKIWLRLVLQISATATSIRPKLSRELFSDFTQGWVCFQVRIQGTLFRLISSFWLIWHRKTL